MRDIKIFDDGKGNYFLTLEREYKYSHGEFNEIRKCIFNPKSSGKTIEDLREVIERIFLLFWE